jgi:hypothetical protein
LKPASFITVDNNKLSSLGQNFDFMIFWVNNDPTKEEWQNLMELDQPGIPGKQGYGRVSVQLQKTK